jgi:hypothetical protein
MEDCESPCTFFHVLRERFEEPPSAVLYNSACNLQHYCLHREPAFFRDVVFKRERPHQRNRNNCSPVYEMPDGGQRAELLGYAAINSQSAEQYHSAVDKISPQLCLMTITNAIMYVMHFDAVYNAQQHARTGMP